MLYAAKAEVDARENEEFAGNLTEKLALLDEAEKILTETDREKAKSTLLGIQRKWDAIGKVPRDSIRTGRRPPAQGRDPRAQARRGPLEQERPREAGAARRASPRSSRPRSRSSRRELAEAKAKGDARKIKDAEDAIAAQRTWLDAIWASSARILVQFFLSHLV